MVALQKSLSFSDNLVMRILRYYTLKSIVTVAVFLLQFKISQVTLAYKDE